MANEEPEDLLELLDLQKSGAGLFTGPPGRMPLPRVFGGQVLAQALAAASFTAPQDWPCHSLHAYFVRPGKPGRPIDYEVLAMRDGQRFATRKVVAVQRDEVNLELIASFAADEPGAEYQGEQMPETPAPESFPPEAERIAALLEQATSPEQRSYLQRKAALEFIGVDTRAPNDATPSTYPRRLWLRTRTPLPSDPNLQRCVLAYASDMGALEPSLRAIGAGFGAEQLQVASLDHALWFHRPFRWDDWLLFVYQSTSVAAGRGLSRGSVFTRDGTLVASIAQEGLMRVRDANAPL